MMKYTLLPMLAAAMTLGFVACEKKAETSTTSSEASEATAEGKTYTVSMTGVV
ncbi:hypothetical protein Rhal01_00296 [Rubritalea halochordaticola]|uniref:Efflux RND transporter periplasmic adaptor subunit n=1 Tax=Rubritalea halochordaticola TaxID=714537 RepID=A0ABP9UWU4_9BACT